MVCVKRKIAVVTLDLVDEAADFKASEIASELLRWLLEDAVSIPWVRAVRDIVIKED